MAGSRFDSLNPSDGEKNDANEKSGNPTPFVKIAKRFVFIGGSIFIVLVILYFCVGLIARPFVISALENKTQTAVHIDRIRLRGLNNIHVFGLKLAQNRTKLGENALVDVGEIELHLAPNRMFMLDFRPTTITLYDTRVRAEYNIADQTWNLSSIQLTKNKTKKPMPSLSFHNGRVLLTIIDQERTIKQTRIGINGHLLAGGQLGVNGYFKLTDLSEKSLTSVKLNEQNNNTVDPLLLGKIAGEVYLMEDSVELDKLNISDLNLEPSLAELLPEQLADKYHFAGPKGVVNIDAETCKLFLMNRHLVKAQWNANIETDRFHLDSINQLNYITGKADAVGGFDFKKAAFTSLDGNFHIDEVSVEDRLFSNMSGQYRFDPQQAKLSCENFKAVCYDGQIHGDFVFKTTDGIRLDDYSLRLFFDDVPLDKLVASQPNEKQPSRIGKMTGLIDVGGMVNNPMEGSGKFKMQLSDMQIGKETLLGKTLSVMRFSEPNYYMFNDMNIMADIDQGLLNFEQIRLSGKSLAVQGTGSIHPTQGTIDLEFTAFGPKADKKASLLDTLSGAFGALLAKVKITGTTTDPNITLVPLPVMQKPLELLPGRKEK